MKTFIFTALFFMFMSGVSFALDDTVDGLFQIGIVQKTTIDQYGSLYVFVRPAFHNLDFDQKHQIARIFTTWGKQQHPGKVTDYLYFRDSRNNKTVGTYYIDRNRLSLSRGYR